MLLAAPVYGPRIATLYERLGVGRDASPEEIRSAYRGLARRLHPDRGGAGSETAMAAVNEAWRVLSDPGRRASYDASLRASVAPATRVSAASEVAEVDVAGEAEARSFWAVALPWILLLVVLGVIFLFTAYARGGGGDGPSSVPRAEVDGVIEPGSCIVLDGQARAVETPCRAPHLGVVGSIVDARAPCPPRSEGFYSQDGSVLVCITRD